MTITSLPVLMCGWEAGEDSQGQASLNIGTAQATGARTGGYGLLCGAGDAWTSDTFQNPVTGLTQTAYGVGMSFSFYIQTHTAGNKPFLAAHRATPNQTYVALNEVGGNQRISLNGGDSGVTPGTFYWTGSTNLSASTLYVCELYTFTLGMGAAVKAWPIRVKLYDNSLSLLDDSGWQLDTSGSTSPASTNSVGLGPGHNTYSLSGTEEIVYDDLYVTASAPPPHGPKLLSIFPNGAGTDTAWTGDYTAVDDVPPGGDFLTTTAASQAETHVGPDVSGTIGATNVLALCSWFYANKTAGTKTMLHRIRTSGGAAVGLRTAVLTTTLAYYSNIFHNSPVSSNAWTAGDAAETDVDDIEFGVQSSISIGVGTFQVDQNFCEVAYGANYTASDWFPSAQYQHGHHP